MTVDPVSADETSRAERPLDRQVRGVGVSVADESLRCGTERLGGRRRIHSAFFAAFVNRFDTPDFDSR